MGRNTADSNLRSLPSWRAMHGDTATWAEDLQLKFYREAPAWRKLEMANELTRGMILLTETGLKCRYPHCSPSELRRRLADVLLGPELAARVYGQIDDAL